MKPEDILKLIDAGYTKDEINAMNQPEEPAPEPEPEEPAPAPEPVEQISESDSVQQIRDELANTRQQLADLVRQMQKNNLATASVNILPQNDLETKTDAAMAELIRPHIEKRSDL